MSPTPAVYRIGGEVKPPVLVTQVKAQLQYPKKGEWELTILLLELVITKDGHVRDVKLLKEPADGVSTHNVQAAMAAVRQWRYSPATLHGEPVDVYLVISFHHFPGKPVA